VPHQADPVRVDLDVEHVTSTYSEQETQVGHPAGDDGLDPCRACSGVSPSGGANSAANTSEWSSEATA
jgi:hypothetical protein